MNILKSRLPISEIFESIQGEGNSQGRIALFVRVQGCPLDCVWCDTKYSVPFSDENTMPIHELKHIISRFFETKRGILVLTGGEPLYFQEQISELMEELPKDLEIEFETSGIYLPNPKIRNYKFNVSPKLSNAKLTGGNKVLRKIYSNLREFSNLNSIFKFVITSEKDIEEVEELEKEYRIPKNKIYLMPEGTTSESILEKSRFIVEKCIQKGYNFSLRQQILLKVK